MCVVALRGLSRLPRRRRRPDGRRRVRVEAHGDRVGAHRHSLALPHGQISPRDDEAVARADGGGRREELYPLAVNEKVGEVFVRDEDGHPFGRRDEIPTPRAPRGDAAGVIFPGVLRSAGVNQIAIPSLRFIGRRGQVFIEHGALPTQSSDRVVNVLLRREVARLGRCLPPNGMTEINVDASDLTVNEQTAARIISSFAETESA